MWGPNVWILHHHHQIEKKTCTSENVWPFYFTLVILLIFSVINIKITCATGVSFWLKVKDMPINSKSSEGGSISKALHRLGISHYEKLSDEMDNDRFISFRTLSNLPKLNLQDLNCVVSDVLKDGFTIYQWCFWFFMQNKIFLFPTVLLNHFTSFPWPN